MRIVGNGEKINLWPDNWLGAPLVSILNGPSTMFPLLTARLHSIIENGRWQNIPSILHYPTVAGSILNISLPLSPLMDKNVWIHATDGILPAKLAFHFLNPPTANLEWASLIWRSAIPPSHSFVFWRLMLSKLPTDENLQLRGCTWYRFVFFVSSKLNLPPIYF